MSNFTIEDYKIAIRANYKEAIKEDVSGVLSDPTPAQLRDFYLRLLERGLSKIDEEILKMFLRANESSSLKKTIENCNIEKFKPIISFLQGRNTENRQRIEMAAILISFQLRPFKKFQDQKGIIQNEEVNNSKIDNFLKVKEETKVENSLDSIETQNAKNEEPSNLQEENEENKIEFEVENVITLPARPLNLFVNIKQKVFETLTKKLSRTSFFILIVFGLGFLISQYIFPKKQCMQWSGDHYEKVDCDLKADGFAGTNIIEPFDENKYKLKKIKVCDTTRFFNNSNDAIIWYAKKSDSAADFFNTHGRHPETNKPLRPVTKYIVTKYGK